jgi:LysR family transcriptional regulator, glycine cleavage system transcriptional activator
MARRLPPLNSLRAFEAVARQLSITRAAAELSVTPAAVSHHIKILEDHLGLELFRRVNRDLLLTDAGQACLPAISDAFARLAAAMDEIDSLGEAGVLTVSVTPSFATKWLVPRLDNFQTRHPNIDVRVSASMQLADFTRDNVDLAIRYGAGRYPDLEVEPLLRESVLPVCSPTLLEGEHALATPEALRHHALLHDDSPDGDASCPTWPMWIKAARLSKIDGNRGPRFNQSSLVLEAAMLGRGVALAKATLAASDLATGRLVRPFDLTFPVDFAYYVVCPRAKLNLPKVSLFRDWLREEASGGPKAVPVFRGEPVREKRATRSVAPV